MAPLAALAGVAGADFLRLVEHRALLQPGDVVEQGLIYGLALFVIASSPCT
jgi:hypothetical protein